MLINIIKGPGNSIVNGRKERKRKIGREGGRHRDRNREKGRKREKVTTAEKERGEHSMQNKYGDPLQTVLLGGRQNFTYT